MTQLCVHRVLGGGWFSRGSGMFTISNAFQAEAYFYLFVLESELSVK